MVAFPKELDEMNEAQDMLRLAWKECKGSSNSFRRLREQRVRTLWARALTLARAVIDWRLQCIDSGATRYTFQGAKELEKSILEKTTPEEIIASGLGKDFADLVAFCRKGDDES